MKTVSDQEAKDLIKQSDKVVIVQLGASWCSPCKALKPKMEALSEAHKEELEVGYIDIDNDPIIAQENGVRGVPTILVYKEGTLKQTLVGNQSQETLENLVKTYAQSSKLNINEDF